MEKHLNEYYTAETPEAALKEIIKTIERARAAVQAEFLKLKLNNIQSEYKKKVKTSAEETKKSLEGIKGQIDSSMSGKLSKKAKSSAETKIKEYDNIIG